MASYFSLFAILLISTHFHLHQLMFHLILYSSDEGKTESAAIKTNEAKAKTA